MNAHLGQDMKCEAYKRIQSMWAAEEGQEELDREKETEKKEKNKMKARKSTREQKNSLEGGQGQGDHK